jgi:spore germination protein (amino acid permease)
MFAMLFISQILLYLTYNPLTHFSYDIWDHIVAALVSPFATLILILPVYILHKKDPSSSVVKKLKLNLKTFGFFLAFIYIVYYLFACCFSLCVFNIFISNVMSPKNSLWIISICVGFASWYAASKGIESLARASSIILFLLLTSIIFMFCSLILKIDFLNYMPPMYKGAENAVSGMYALVSQNFCIAAIGGIFPFVKNNVKKSLVSWVLLSHVFLILIIILVVGSLGDYLKTQMFPVYTAATVAQIGALQKLDSIFLALWTTSLFCKISMFSFLISNAFKELLGKKAAKILLAISTLFVITISTVFSCNSELLKIIFNPSFGIVFTLVVTLLIPGILIIRIRNKQPTK